MRRERLLEPMLIVSRSGDARATGNIGKSIPTVTVLAIYVGLKSVSVYISWCEALKFILYMKLAK